MKKNLKCLVKLFLWCIMICSFILLIVKNSNNIDNNKADLIACDSSLEEEIVVESDLKIDEQIIQEENIPETYTTMYTTVVLNIREEPSFEGYIIKTVNINTELQVVDNSDQGMWIKIKDENNYYYVASQFLSKEKIEIKTPVLVDRNNNTLRNNTEVLTKSKGVNYYNGHKETWYSQKVLPGGGLKIPGRHVDERGLVCDGDGYICVASSDYPKGTIVETSLGTGKVYDCGCPKNTIDIYTNWE